MKKTAALALLLCLLLCSTAFAIALPAGTTYEQYVAGEVYFGDVELSTFLGRPLQEYEDYLAQYANITPGGDVRVSDFSGPAICRISVEGGNFTLYGYKVDGRDDGIDEKMKADGWTETGGWFEGGLTQQIFEKNDGNSLLTFKIWACDSVITLMELESSKPVSDTE